MAAHEADRFPSINDADLDALLEARDANNIKRPRRCMQYKYK
jgi:hypothetical protein